MLTVYLGLYAVKLEDKEEVLFAMMLGFQPADFNKLDDSEKGVVDQVPQIKF